MKTVATSFLISVALMSSTYANTDLGSFGAWNVSRITGPDGIPQCLMMQLTKRERDATTMFTLIPGMPKTVGVMLLLTVGGFGGVTKGDKIIVYFKLNGKSAYSTTYIAMDNFLAFGYAPTENFKGMVDRIAQGLAWSWEISVPVAQIDNLEIPFQGFVSAARAFENCGSELGVPF